LLGARDTVPTTEEPIVIYLEPGVPYERRILHGTIKAAKHHSSKEHVSPQPSASALGTRIASRKCQSTMSDGSPRFDHANQSHSF